MLADRKLAILVIDDHELIRRGLRDLINGTEDMRVCGEAASAHEAMERLANDGRLPDLAIVDISLPDGNGIELIKRLQTRHPPLRILVSSMHDEELYAERSLLAGAAGYINKQETAALVLEALRHISSGQQYLSPRMAQRLAGNCYANDSDTSTSPVSRLSDRELEVFELIGSGCRTVEIAESLHLSVKTIETYRANIKRKLKLESGAALTRSAVQWAIEEH